MIDSVHPRFTAVVRGHGEYLPLTQLEHKDKDDVGSIQVLDDSDCLSDLRLGRLLESIGRLFYLRSVQGESECHPCPGTRH